MPCATTGAWSRTEEAGCAGVRENRSGRLVSLVYGRIIARNTDPIEKKPLFHFLPGTASYSIATVGCNFKCVFCQNANISQMPADHGRIMGTHVTPRELVDAARAGRCASISYTYTEPTVYFELALDTARLAAEEGLKNVFVSNGYMTGQCLEAIGHDLHAANVDLKSFSDTFYRQRCGARLQPVLDTLVTMKRLGVWLEVTTLLIPGLNDSREELARIAGFLVDLDPDIPWHVSAFHPTYRLTGVHPTPAASLRTAKDIGYEAGLNYVYTGNLPGDEGENTFCRRCGEQVIGRHGFRVHTLALDHGACPKCGTPIPGEWG